MEIGTAMGLAQSGQYDQQINDLYRREEADQRAAAMARAKTDLFMKDVEFQNAANQFDSVRVKNFAQSQIQKIGEFYRNNPDLDYNPAKRAQLKMLTNDLKNNPDLIRGLASDNAYKSYLKDLEEVTKNPSQHDTEAFQQYQQEWKNYELYGNQKGKEAAEKEGAQAFIYSRPQNLVDLNAGLPEIGSKIKNLEYKTGKNPGEVWADVPDSTLNEAVKGVFADPAMRRSVELLARKSGWSPEQTSEFVKTKILSGVDNKYQPGDPTAWRRLAIAEENLRMNKAELAAKLQGEAPAVTTWDEFANPRFQAGQVDQKAVTDIYGNTKLVVKGANGKEVDLTGKVWKSDGNFMKATDGPFKGTPFLSGQIEMDATEARNLGLIYDPWGPGDAEPSPGFTDRVQVREAEKDGKKYKYVVVKHEIPVDIGNQSHKSRYNQLTMPSKLVPGAQDRFSQPVPSASKQDWINAGWSEDQINQAATQGKIKVQ